jgi:hypothetical protein
MSSLRTLRFSGILGLGLGLALASACSAGSSTGGSGLHGSGGGNGSGSGATGSGATGSDVSSGASSGTTNINTGNASGTDPDAGSCQHKELNFVPKIPSVFVLVDRSGSMFDSNAWDPLKAGVLSVIMQLQGQIKFGFSAFTGQKAPGTCPIFSPVAPALNNYDEIKAAYDPLTKLDNPKGETPVGLALPLVQQSLNSAGNDGDKYILFVTDGEPDFCDDGDSVCPVDSTVAHLQALKVQGITTIVFGLKSTLSDISDATLQAFANAGAGQPVALPFGTRATSTQNVCYNCNSVPGWKAEWTTTAPDCAATTPASQALATYSPTDGKATLYRPDAADQTALTQQIAAVVSGIKSCIFDLSDFTVNLDRLSEASVSVSDQAVPFDMTNGWRMNNSSQLELVGSACTNWQQPQNTKIDFNFPCDILVPVK